MTVAISVQENVSIGGLSFNSYTTVLGNNPEAREDSLIAAKPASAWVKTDANTAACNLAADHGVITGNVDVYWTGGRRYGVDCTVTVNALALEGGAGDDFPASDEATVVVSQQIVLPISFLATTVSMLRVLCDKRAHVGFQKADNTSLLELDLTAGATYRWDGVGTNPFSPTDPIAQIVASCGDIYDATLKVGKLASA